MRTDKTIEFKYNPFGQRIIKKVNNLTLGTTTTSYYAYDANGQVMGIYDVNLTSNNASLNELNIYGASRIGMIDKEVILCIGGTAQTAPVYPAPVPVTHILGYKKYEITNYLRNVNAVISDRKIYTGGTYVAVMLMNSDYYPFGMAMPGRHKDEDKYRFGYNGMEMDNEVKDNGNSYTTEFRQYDPRLGRWLSLDPLMMQFPWMSPYVAFDDNPIYFTDPLGLAAEGGPRGGPKNPDENAEYTDKKGNNWLYQDGKWKNYGEGATAAAKRKPIVYEAKEYNVLNTQPSDRLKKSEKPISFDELKRREDERDQASGRKAMEELQNGSRLQDGRDDFIRRADYNGELYAPVLNNVIPGWELAGKLGAGEEIGATEVFIEIIGVVPVGRLFTRGRRLFVRGAKSTDEAIEVTDEMIKLCFAKGTKISSEDGLKEIEDIQVGDSVWAFDETTGNKALKVVYNTVVRQADHLLRLTIGTDTLKTTDDHPFYVNGNWIKAMNLNVGDSLDLLSGGKVVLSERSRIDTLVTVYNFAVRDYATYYVGEQQILVHNNNPCATVKKTAAEIAKDCKKMTESQIEQALGKGWHQNGAKSKLIKKHLKELKGSTNADLYFDRVTGEILLKGNKSGAWVQTGLITP